MGTVPKKNPQMEKSLIQRQGFNDRISVFCGKTLQLRAYEPTKVDIGYTSDVGADETVEEAYERVSSFVAKRLSKEVRELRDSTRKKSEDDDLNIKHKSNNNIHKNRKAK